MRTYRFDTNYTDYFTGRRFTTYLSARLSRPELRVPNRINVLAELVKGKSVIHVGCVDHLEILAEQRKKGLWLHDLLMQQASRCVGLDLNQAGIDYLTSTGCKEVFCHDLLKDDPLPILLEQQWDYLLLGEVIEHVDNPVDFLSSIRRKYAGRVKNILITTPNALKFDNFRAALTQREIVSSDHRCWFSPLTFSRLLAISGYTVDWYTFCQYDSGPRGLTRNLIFRLFPLLRDTFVMAATMQPL